MCFALSSFFQKLRRLYESVILLWTNLPVKACRMIQFSSGSSVEVPAFVRASLVWTVSHAAQPFYIATAEGDCKPGLMALNLAAMWPCTAGRKCVCAAQSVRSNVYIAVTMSPSLHLQYMTLDCTHSCQHHFRFYFGHRFLLKSRSSEIHLGKVWWTATLTSCLALWLW